MGSSTFAVRNAKAEKTESTSQLSRTTAAITSHTTGREDEP
jgi:hypothetical protein